MASDHTETGRSCLDGLFEQKYTTIKNKLLFSHEEYDNKEIDG